MNAEISERARLIGFGMQIPELLALRKFFSGRCHAHSDAHTDAHIPPKVGVDPTKSLTPTNRTKNFKKS